MGDYVPRWLWEEWALMVDAADANVQSYLLWKAKRDAEFHNRMGF